MEGGGGEMDHSTIPPPDGAVAYICAVVRCEGGRFAGLQVYGSPPS